MAVGTKILDPDTQEAIRQQSGQATPAAPAAATEETPVTATETVVETETPQAEEVTPETDESAETPNMDDVTLPSQEEVDKALAEAGFSNEALGKELAENDGKLTEATVKALKEKFGETAVDNAVADMERQFAEQLPEAQAKGQEATAAVASMNDYIYGTLAGGDIAKGKENLAVLSEWAGKHMDKKELALINKKLASGDKDLVTEGLQQAVAKWKKGQVRPMMTGDSAAAAVPAAPEFEPMSRDEFVKAMATKKYQEDPEYAAKIDDRRRRSMAQDKLRTIEYSSLRPPL